MTLYKAVRLDGTDFYTGTVSWAAPSTPVRRPRIVTHPTSHRGIKGIHATSLAVSTTTYNLPGAPYDHRQMRLLTVEPAGFPVIETDSTKRQSVQWLVTGEIPSWHRYGPMGEHVARLIEQVASMTPEQVALAQDATQDDTRDAAAAAWDAAVDASWYGAGDDEAWYAAGDAAWYATWYAARDAAWDDTRDAAWDDTWDAAGYAARDAAWAITSRDLIGQHGYTQEHYDTLTRQLRLAGVTVHPDDGPLQ